MRPVNIETRAELLTLDGKIEGRDCLNMTITNLSDAAVTLWGFFTLPVNASIPLPGYMDSNIFTVRKDSIALSFTGSSNSLLVLRDYIKC